MSVQKINVFSPPLAGNGPAVAWLSRAASWLFASPAAATPTLSGWLAQGSERAAEARAARRTARDRAELVALAGRYASSQPEFAKDLLAAARNERAH